MPIFTRGAYSLRGRAGEDAFPEAGEHPELGLAEAIEEAATHPREMGGPCLLEPGATRVGELGVQPPAVSLTACALHGPCLREAVDEPGQPALAEDDRGREVGHPHPVLGGLGEHEKHLVLLQGEIMSRPELRIEVVDEGAVNPEQTAPRGELQGSEKGGVDGRCLHMQLFSLTQQVFLNERVPSSSTGDNGETKESAMRLEGIHHVTCITGDAPGNVDFYTRVLGLRMVKKTVNQDDPTVYHLFYADEHGSPGADITFFEYPGARRGRAGTGMVHTITFRVSSDDTLDFWEARLGAEEILTRRTSGRLGFDDPEGLGLELAVISTADVPLVAKHPEIPAEHALQGFDSVRAFAPDPEGSRALLEGTLGFVAFGENSWEVRGAVRGGHYGYDRPPASGSGIPGAGTVHHVAFASNMDEQDAWLDAVRRAGQQASGVIDRFWFRSIYFREPSGVLFEIATMGPGFTVDEEVDHLGEALILPPAFEHLRTQIEPVLTPLPDPRAAWAAS
jgi:glyoxalase family protein